MFGAGKMQNGCISMEVLNSFSIRQLTFLVDIPGSGTHSMSGVGMRAS